MKRIFVSVLCLLVFSTSFAVSEPPQCRCKHSKDCWPNAKYWSALKLGLKGKLITPVSPLQACYRNANSKACQLSLVKTHNPFYLQSIAGGTQSQGWLDAWQALMDPRAVEAVNIDDVVAAVNFARKQNIRLVIKGAGHDYLGRSSGTDALLLWTHKMNSIKYHSAFVPKGCAKKMKAVPAVTVEAGARWLEVYNEVTTKHKQYVQGGGCTTVGAAGGFTQGGGFGSFSKQFGTGAAGVLEAQLVTANGYVVTANACQNQDLFWAIKGGGGSTFGVVTKITYMTHPLPKTFGLFSGSIEAKDSESYKKLIRQFLLFFRDQLNNPNWGEQFSFRPDNTIGIFMVYQGLPSIEADKAWHPLLEWLSKHQKQYTMSHQVIDIPPQKMWDLKFWRKHQAGLVIRNPSTQQFWWQPNSGEVYKFWYTYQSHWIPAKLFSNQAIDKLAEAVYKASRLGVVSFHMNKGLAGASEDAAVRGGQTSMNPSVYKAAALVIMSAGTNKARLGVRGMNPDRKKAQQQVGKINQAMMYFRELAPHAGSYVNEADFFQKNWQQEFWGENYPKLLVIKKKYDPTGVFYCHHCVGSELWDAHGMCRKKA